MRHTETIIAVQGIRYAVSERVLKQVHAVLKRAKAQPEKDYYLAEELFPEMDDPIKGPANYLRGIRQRERLTQVQLAKKAGMLQHHISEMERGKRTITKAAAKKLAAILNTDWKRML